MNPPAPSGRNGCPGPEALRAFQGGRLSAAGLESVADHLAVCSACASVFDALGEDDPVVSKLRLYLPQATPPLDPECERLAAAARLIPMEPTGAVTDHQETATLYPPGESPEPPRRFGGYELIARLGHGGMGMVWKARQVRLNRLVALKVIRFAVASDGPERERFRLEGEAVARVKHPNIVEVYDADEFDGQPFLAMELLGGGTLARRMIDRPYTPREAAGLVRTLALAVQAAHEAGVVHRDLKPTNVLFAADDTPKVADFGLAKLLDAETGQTRTGDVLGTPAYMAPEQARGDAGRIGPRTDVYGLGAILYELLHGKPPFRGADRKAVLKQVLHVRPEPATRKQGEPGQGLAAVCAKCLEKEPRDRYPSAAALAEDLDRWLDGRPPEAKRPGPLLRAGRFVRRRKFLCTSLAACGLGAAAGLTGWWFLQPDPDAEIKEIEKRLARGEAVELLGKGPTSRPAWSRVVMGKPETDRSSIDTAFRLQGITPAALLELVRDPQMDRYVFRAEVRHEAGQGFVGLYFGRREYATPGGPAHVFVQLGFNDIYSEKKQAEDLTRDIPQLRDHPDARIHVPKANRLILQALLDCPEPNQAGVLEITLQREEVVEPHGPQDTRFRLVVVKITPDTIRVFLDGLEQPALLAPTAAMGRQLGASLGNARTRAKVPFPKDVLVAFTPRGGLGLWLSESAASFQNVRVEPLGAAE